ncbi:MAG TPA: HDIG domain-containing protein [Kofleriaceae bacterium]|jgi:hypothetical protein
MTTHGEEALPRAPSNADPRQGPKAELARVIPRRPRVSPSLLLVFAFAFATLATPIFTAERMVVALGAGHVHAWFTAKRTVRVPPFAGAKTRDGVIGGGGGGGVVIGRGDVATPDDEARVLALAAAEPHGLPPYAAYFLLGLALAGLFAHHLRRSTYGRLVRVQATHLALLLATALGVKALMMLTSVSVLVVPVALFALVPTLALDRVVGLATGTLAALVVSLLLPFDVGVAIVLLVQAGTAGLVVAERPKSRLRAALVAGGLTTAFTAITYPLLVYLTTWELPFAELRDPLHSAWIAAAIGPAIATALALPLLPLYQRMVGEITHGKLVELEDLSHPLLKQIADKAPGTWQHSLMMANLAELAANAIGANGRLVRVGAYFHDLGKSIAPKYFIENLEPGETSPHDQLPPSASCDAIFSHVTDGIKAARKAGLHERIVDFMHMHHGNGVLEYFWSKHKEQAGKLSVEHFRYPGVPPQSRETAILAICDAVEAASRTLKKPEPAAVDTLVQRIVYGKLHLGQLDDSGLSMADLRRVADSLRDTIKHANHGRIEYPWQKAQQDASASAHEAIAGTGPRLDSLDRPAKPDPVRPPRAPRDSGEEAYAVTGAVATPKLRVGKGDAASASENAIGIQTTEPVELEPRSTVVGVAAAEAPPERATPPPPPKPDLPPEVKLFATEAKQTLDEVAKEALQPASADAPSGARKRAATLPSLRATIPPPPKTTLAGAMWIKPPARGSTPPGSIPPDEAATTNPRLELREQDDAPSSLDDTSPNLELPLPAPADSSPAWSRGLAARIDAQLDDGFGLDTPERAPSRAELQALLDSPPDPTRVQPIEEIERLQRATLTRRSQPVLEATRRVAPPTAEVDEDDIEAAIELAPAARRGAIGVEKKKKKE